MGLKQVLEDMLESHGPDAEKAREVAEFFLSAKMDEDGVYPVCVGGCGHVVKFPVSCEAMSDLIAFHGVESLYAVFDAAKAEMEFHATKESCDAHRSEMDRTTAEPRWLDDPPSDIKKMEVNLPPYLVAELERLCRDQRKTMAQVLKEAITTGINPRPELKLEHLQSTPVVLKQDETQLAPKLTLLVRQAHKARAQVVDVAPGDVDRQAEYDDEAASMGLISYVRADLLSKAARLEFAQAHAASMALVRTGLAEEHDAIDEIWNAASVMPGITYVVEKWVTSKPGYTIDPDTDVDPADFDDKTEVCFLSSLDQANRWEAKSVVGDVLKADFERMQFRIFKVTAFDAPMPKGKEFARDAESGRVLRSSVVSGKTLVRVVPDADQLDNWRFLRSVKIHDEGSADFKKSDKPPG